MPTDDVTFAAEFPAATREQWLKLVDGVLKGAPFDKRLVSRTRDNIAIEPLYPRAKDATPVAGRTPGLPWQVVQRVDHPDAAQANAEALHDLENGATGLTLAFAGGVGAYGYGIASSAAALEKILDGVFIDGISLDLDLAWDSSDAPAHIANIVKQRGLDPAKLDFRMNFDPIGSLAHAGKSLVDWPTLAPRFARMIGEFGKAGYKGPFALADGRMIHAAGGSEAQELAFVLASAVSYLRAFEAGGIALDKAARMIAFKLAADADQFLTTAKFRALRKLWARVEDACGLAPSRALVSAETAWRMMTQRDPWVNLLRTTVATFAAGVGGADSIAVLPFTQALGLPDRFARRLARNTQLILIEEASVAKVGDPTAGSGAIEDLTTSLCETAWQKFQEIEKAGGAWKALQAGLIQRDVAAVRAERMKAVARGRDALTGTSAFPNIGEEPVAVLHAQPLAPPAHGPVEVTIEALPAMRLAEPFEALRDASDRIFAQTGSRPKIFLANLGTPSDFTARATFAKNFFESGGIEAVTNDGFAREANAAVSSPLPAGERSTPQASGEGERSSQQGLNPSPGPSGRPLPMGEVGTDLAALVAAYKISGAPLACICSSDKLYAAEAIAAARALASAGATQIYLAGRPGDLEAALKAANVKDFIYAGCDILATLGAAHDKLATKLSGRS